MHSMSFFLKCAKPSRITSHCAFLINDIFTNNMESNTISGSLMNGIREVNIISVTLELKDFYCKTHDNKG